MRRGPVIAVVAGAVIVLVVGAALWWWLSRPPGAGPEDVARTFLSALEEGDGERAMSLVDDPPQDAAEIAAAFVGATERPHDASVRRVESRGGRSARADVSFELADESHEASFGLVETADGWRVDADALGTLTATTTIGDAVTVGEVVAPANAPFPLLPALYAVAPAPSGLLDGEASAVVLPGGRAEAEVEASVSPQAAERAQAQLEEYARACAQPADAVPAACGLRVPWAADLATLDTIAFRIERMPQLALSPDATSFDATGGVITATATGTTREGATASFTYRAEDWALRGTVSFEGDDMVLAVG